MTKVPDLAADPQNAQNNLCGSSLLGGRNAGVKISATVGVRGRFSAITRMSIDFF
jgi:hypothetical protein